MLFNLFCMKVFTTIGPMCVLVEMVSRSYAPGEVILKHQICSEETVRFDQGTFLGVYNRTANLMIQAGSVSQFCNFSHGPTTRLPISHFFWKLIILKWNVTLLNKNRNFMVMLVPV